MFAAKSHGHHQIGAVHDRHEARLHGHAVGVFDAGSEAEHFNVIASKLAREVGQVGERGHHADFGGLSRHGCEPDNRDGHR